MHPQTPRDFAIVLADRYIAQYPFKTYGISDHDGYLAHLDKTSTVHLSEKQANRLHRTSGQQRRKAQLRIIDGKLIIIITSQYSCENPF